jgi:hypothetical protein
MSDDAATLTQMNERLGNLDAGMREVRDELRAMNRSWGDELRTMNRSWGDELRTMNRSLGDELRTMNQTLGEERRETYRHFATVSELRTWGSVLVALMVGSGVLTWFRH